MEKHYLGYRRARRTNTQYTEGRNAALIDRYYFLSEIRRLRFDDVVFRLSCSFFLSEQYVMKILGDNITQFEQVCTDKPSRECLKTKWPEWEWS